MIAVDFDRERVRSKQAVLGAGCYRSAEMAEDTGRSHWDCMLDMGA